jgi:C-terminal processing protease CtpA/Prc
MIKPLLLALTAAPSLVLLVPVGAQSERSPKPDKVTPMVASATFGMTTSAVSIDEAKARKLKIGVRVRGQLVTKLEKGGPAAKAGILVGDVIEKIDTNDIYSQDDIADFLGVSKQEQAATVHLVRKQDDKKEQVRVALGSKRVAAPTEPRLEWQFSSLGQLDEALAKAKKENRLVLVGLSGAET